MSGKISTTCSRCGPVEALAAASSVSTPENVYRFRCPSCGAWIVKEVRPEIVALLLRVGVPVIAWQQVVTDGFRDDQRPDPSLPPITTDELVEFHLLLDRLPTADH
jgi:hypothetical protein